MINRFKSALLNAVSNAGIDSSASTNGSPSVVNASSPSESRNTAKTGSNDRSQRHHHRHHSSTKHEGRSSNSSTGNSNNSGTQRIRKYEYCRPHFLQLTTQDEVSVSADHVVRPIIVPRDPLPWDSGYAEYERVHGFVLMNVVV